MTSHGGLGCRASGAAAELASMANAKYGEIFGLLGGFPGSKYIECSALIDLSNYRPGMGFETPPEQNRVDGDREKGRKLASVVLRDNTSTLQLYYDF